jgi:hypothetical protein
MVQIKCADGCPADGGQPKKAIFLKGEMTLPFIMARIEERHSIASLRIGGFGPIGLSEIARRTGESQIIQVGVAPSRPRNHMFNMKVAPCKPWCIRQYSHRPSGLVRT